MPTGQLRSREAALYDFLSANAGRDISREELFSAVWDMKYFASSRTLDQTVASLRKKLGPEDGRIVTVEGVGYRFEV